MKERNRLGYRIRRQREDLGLSKSEFSRRVGVTPTAVHNWEENGVVPRTELMIEIAKVLGVNASDLTGQASGEDYENEGPTPDPDYRDNVDDFKRAMAAKFNVSPAQIEIVIRF